MKKTLITGGAGFVATHLVNELSKNSEYSIVIFDNFSIGSKENILEKENVSWIQGDISNKEELQNALQGVDVIIHLAAIVSVTVCEQYPDICTKNNIIGTKNIFELAKYFGIKKIIYASSAAVYGNLSSSSISEQDPTIPISQYGISKLENEKLAQTYSTNIQSIGLRFFNIYGPGLSMVNAYPSVLISFFKNIQKQIPITIYGDGTQTRDFIHVSDIVQAIHLALTTDINGSHIFNVGTGIQTSIIELAQHIQKLIPTVKINFENKRDFDIKQSCADISKIQSMLHFKPNQYILDDIQELCNIYLLNL